MKNTKKSNLIIGISALTLATLTSCTITFNANNSKNSEFDSVENIPPSVFVPDSTVDQHPSTPQPSISSKPFGEYILKFSDEFEGNSLNKNYWNVEIGTGANYGLTDWGNGEAQYYREENVKVSDGTLKITAKREGYNGKQFTSGRIQTRDKVYYTYGYFEARISMPVGTGLWPAFWMLPNNESIYKGWASSGEIDIMEARGRLPFQIDTTLHFGGQWPNNVHKGDSHALPNGDRMDTFHTYGAEWTSEYIAFYIDRQQVYKLTNNVYYSAAAPNNPSAPFDVDFYVLLNFAIGGNFDGYRMPEGSFQSADMEIDYVKIWQLKN